MISGIDPNATTPDRIRRNWANLSKFGVLALLPVSAPLALTGSPGTLSLTLATTGGLKNATGLSLKLDTTPGLVLASTGVKVLLDPTNPGLQLTSGLKVTVNAAGALTQTATGLQVAVDNTTLAVSSNQLIVKAGGIGSSQLGILTTKGDLLAFSTVHARLPVGTDGQLLTADAASTPGVKWAAPITGTSTDSTLSIGVSLSASSNALSGVYQIIGPTLTLAAAGTYLVTYAVHGAIQSTTVGDLLICRLFNITDAAAVTNSEIRLCTAQVASVADDHTSTGTLILTIAASKSIRLEAEWSTGGAGTPSAVSINSGTGGRTRITAVRLI